MAGAYSMSGIMVDLMLAQQPYGEPFYFPYVLFAYLEYYPDIGSTEGYLLPEYWFLENWFDGYHSSSEINEAMPSIPITIMSPEAIQDFENNMDHPLRLSLQENDLWDWSPLATMYIFHGEGDELVPYANAELAYNQFIEYGVENIYDYCSKLQKNGVTILRPPRDGRMAFVKSPDKISIELLQLGEPLPLKEPWISMENQGKW